MLKVSDLRTFVGYGISGLMAVVGILVLSGILITKGTPTEMRVLFGIVLILYGVYRFVITRIRAKQTESPDE